MKEGPDIARVAMLIGDPARANMLTALMSGKALTASELAHEAGITAQTASSHLTKLSEGGLVSPRKQGRHKYFELASEGVAQLLESLMGVAANIGHLRTRTGPKDGALRKARVCYNHLAGDMGTHLFDALKNQDCLSFSKSGLALTPRGEKLMTKLGIELDDLHTQRTPLCRECLDWSERRSHLAGSLGRALLSRFMDLGWAKRENDSRIVRFTKAGEARFYAIFQNSKT